jgi:hypothetical protein
MEAQNKERAEELLELINKGRYFTKLKPEANEANSFTIPLKVSSYNELNLMVSDLLKQVLLCLIQMRTVCRVLQKTIMSM